MSKISGDSSRPGFKSRPGPLILSVCLCFDIGIAPLTARTRLAEAMMRQSLCPRYDDHRGSTSAINDPVFPNW
jgi:hypothetical protein